jgi:hypothetical protein
MSDLGLDPQHKKRKFTYCPILKEKTKDVGHIIKSVP